MVCCLTQAKKAQQALALCLAQIRTQDPQTQRTTTFDPNAVLQVNLAMSALTCKSCCCPSFPKIVASSFSSSGMPAKARIIRPGVHPRILSWLDSIDKLEGCAARARGQHEDTAGVCVVTGG